MKILVVDDEPAVRKMYTQAFELAGHTVIIATNGSEALDRATHDKPDVIFLDIIMPITNGFDVLADLKKDSVTKEIPVYLLTNLPESNSSERAHELGAAGYLVKAKMEPEQLTRILSSLAKNT